MNPVLLTFISSFISAMLGGGAMYVFAFKSKKREAKAHAMYAEEQVKGHELDNIRKTLQLLDETNEKLANEYRFQCKKSGEMKIQLDKLTNEVKRLSDINTEILHLLDKITPENLSNTVTRMKKIIKQ